MVTPFLITPESRPNSFADPTVSKQIPSERGRDSVQERQRLLAYHFRERMTKDSSLEKTNEYRQSFFKEVTEGADEVGFHGWSTPFEDDLPSSSPKSLQKFVLWRLILIRKVLRRPNLFIIRHMLASYST